MRIPALAESVSEIVMVDRNSVVNNPISLAHIQVANKAQGCIPIAFVQANLHDKQLPLLLGMKPASRSAASSKAVASWRPRLDHASRASADPPSPLPSSS
jgi:hypothetical protein